MLKNIEGYIQSFADYLLATIRKEQNNGSGLSGFVTATRDEFKKYNIDLSPDECILFLLAFIPHIYPNFYDEVIKEAMPQGGDFPEFGGVRGSNHRGLLPTGETAQFIIAGTDFDKRLHVQKILQNESTLLKEYILWLDHIREGEPVMSGRIIIADDWLQRILFGKEAPPKFSPDFPAKKITTPMTWKDLVLNDYTQVQVNDILVWLNHNQTLFKDEALSKKIKPGYKILFYGPSGTGKTLTATLLGKQFEKDVYRIDLSQVVSKYIGETEKNLEKVFSKAENKDWILFFDEADALFGKRTNVQNSHDRYANQEVSYLLQRIEDYTGLVILASNFKNNLDSAFVRRFNSIVNFPLPNAKERLLLWQRTIPSNIPLDPAIILGSLADKYELTGASILNVIYYAALKSLSENDTHIRSNHVLDGIRKEFRKDDRSMN